MDPYARLGLEPGASADEIKRAWKRLAREHHPDRNPGDPEAADRFKQIKEAWEALRDGTWRPTANQRRSERGPPPEWLDVLEWMIEARRREVMEQILPRLAGAYGPGAELAWVLGEATDLEAAAAAHPARRAPLWLRRLRLEVLMDERPWGWKIASIERRADGRVQVLISAPALWRREPEDDDALRRLVFAAVDHGVAAAVPVALSLRRLPRSQEEAAAADRVASLNRWVWRGIWGAVATLSAALIGWAALH